MPKTGVKFSKQKVLQSSQLTQVEKDILTAMLPDGEYTLQECFDLLKKFKESKVKE